MSRSMNRLLLAGAVVGTALWTLTAVGAWWLLQAAAGSLEGGSTAATMQAVTAWSERPWVRHWLDPQDVEMLRDGIDWLVHLGGGPGQWVGTALTWLAAALVMVWAGGLVLALVVAGLAFALMRRTGSWWRHGARGPWSRQHATERCGES